MEKLSLRELFQDDSRFLCGVELVTTRGTLGEANAVQARHLAADLAQVGGCDWVSITDNAGGNPMLSPMALGTPALYAGREVLIHLSCKDSNRNGLESQAWHLASHGFQNILALTGDYPVSGYQGPAKPVFDIDSVGLLSLLREMNRGLKIPRLNLHGQRPSLRPTDFFLGTVASSFKLKESELVPQYLKLEKKIAAGAEFVIAQIGYDARKSSELKAYLDGRKPPGVHRDVPLVGNVFLLNDRVASFFRTGRIPGVVVTDKLVETCRRAASSPDGGRAFFLEFAAKQLAIFRGLKYRGAYFGGIARVSELERIFEIAASFGPGDWQQFAREIRFSRPGEFFYFAEDPATGLADPARHSAEYQASRKSRASVRRLAPAYQLGKLLHKTVFTPGRTLFRLASRIYAKAKHPEQGPPILRVVERTSKLLMFSCQDCGDCSLPEIAFLCPESQCPKNQRNGPCGGTREGRCEVTDKECIWARAYDRLKRQRRELHLLDHAPVLQNHGLRGTSSWANTFLGLDHYAHGRAHSESGEAGALRAPLPEPAGRGSKCLKDQPNSLEN